MAVGKDAIMRLLVFFDLPTKSKKDRKEAARFRTHLLQDGFEMVQLSVYMRVCKGESAVEKHKLRVQSAIPEYGHVRVMSVTELQYTRMKVLGSVQKRRSDKPLEQLTLL